MPNMLACHHARYYIDYRRWRAGVPVASENPDKVDVSSLTRTDFFKRFPLT
jgi:hypothetical protein